jgi:hypothetical protein
MEEKMEEKPWCPWLNKLWIHIVNEPYEFITLGGGMNSYVERRYEFIEQTLHMNSYVCVRLGGGMNSYVESRYEFIEQTLHMNSYVCVRYEFIDKNNIWIHRQSQCKAFLAGGAFFACTALRLDDFFPRFDDGFFPAPRFVCLANGEADSSESDDGENIADSPESEDGGDGAIAFFFLAFFAGAFLAPPRFVRLANREADSSESDDGKNTADSSESEDGGDGAIAVFDIAFFAVAFFACTALRLDGASSVAMCASAGSASSAAAATAAGGAVSSAINEGGAAGIRAMGTATEAATGAWDAIALLSNAASSLAMPLADFTPLSLGLLGSANRATAASSVSDDDAGKSTADETTMASSAAVASAVGGATVRAAPLVERLRIGRSPTAGSVVDSEGGVFLAMTDLWIQWRRWIFWVRLIGDMKSCVGLKRKRDAASWWWWQMLVCGDVALMWQQVRTHKWSFRENTEN